jgi:hypothetical protein
MEVGTLLLSKILPKEIVLHEIYKHLYKLKKPISEDLQRDIQENIFHLQQIVRHYYNNGLFSKQENHPNYFLFWLENDLCYILNDERPLATGVSVNLLFECPLISIEFLVKNIPLTQLHSRIYELWRMLTYKKKMIMYEYSIVVL